MALIAETYCYFQITSWLQGRNENLSKEKDWREGQGRIPRGPELDLLSWKIPWTEEPGRLPSMGSLRVGHD